MFEGKMIYYAVYAMEHGKSLNAVVEEVIGNMVG